MKQQVIDSLKGIGTGTTGVVGIEGVQDMAGNDTVGLALQVIIAVVTAGRPVVQMLGGLLGLFKKKKPTQKS